MGTYETFPAGLIAFQRIGSNLLGDRFSIICKRSFWEGKDGTFHDTDLEDIQSVALNDLELAWDVNVPGLGKRNRLATLNIPNQIATTETLICRSIGDECRLMLTPPVSMLGIPAMEKLRREIANWAQELGMDTTRLCLSQVREYLNSPPDILGHHLTAGRDIYIRRSSVMLSWLTSDKQIDRLQRGSLSIDVSIYLN